MKKLFLTAVLASTLALAACAGAAPTTQLPENPNLQMEEADDDIIDFPDIWDGAYFPSFMFHTGTITEINQLFDGEGYFVSVADEFTGSIVNFAVDHNTALLLGSELAVGLTITGYYDTSLPVPMIYPPQYHARVILGTMYTPFLLDRFDKNLKAFSSPNTLVITDQTVIVLEDGGEPYGGVEALHNRLLLVEFDEEGLEITPTKITVLFEIAVPPIHFLTDEELDGLATAVPGGPLLLSPEDLEMMWANMFDPETVEIIVNGEVIDAATPFVDSEAGTIMLPVAAIAEALGLPMVPDGDNALIIGRGSIIQEGVNSYFVGRMAPFELSAAPVIVDGVMFVPWEFFGTVVDAFAYVEDGNIIVGQPYH